MIAGEAQNRYAKVLYRLASSKEKIGDDLIAVANIFENTPALRNFLLAPQIRRQDKENVLRKLFADKSEPVLLNFLFFLLEKGRIPDLSLISKAYEHIAAKESETLEAKMTTATPMDQSIRVKIQKSLEKGFNKKVAIEEKVDPDILGGIILMIGNQLMDASVRSQLADLKENLLSITV